MDVNIWKASSSEVSFWPPHLSRIYFADNSTWVGPLRLQGFSPCPAAGWGSAGSSSI